MIVYMLFLFCLRLDLNVFIGGAIASTSIIVKKGPRLGEKQLPEPMMPKFYDAIWRHHYIPIANMTESQS